MKHNLKVTSVLLGMFLLTQLIGLMVVYSNPLKINYVSENGTIIEKTNPYFKWASLEPGTEKEFTGIFIQMIISFFIAILLLFVLMNFRVEFFLKIWFFVVIVVALLLSFTAFGKLLGNFAFWNASFNVMMLVSFALALSLAFVKVFRGGFLIHNLTELLIYPGIAAIFVPILNLFTLVLLLILISVYDMWAVWHSGIMQKMAKYQIKKLKIFSGFFVPYAPNAKVKKYLQEIKKAKSSQKKNNKYKKIKINVAILGGGDVVFPIIASGVVLNSFSSVSRGAGLISAGLVVLGAVLGLLFLFLFSEKKKFYPAMPFITAGIFLGILTSRIIF